MPQVTEIISPLFTSSSRFTLLIPPTHQNLSPIGPQTVSRYPCRYYMVILGIYHQFLGTPVGIKWSYLNFDISSLFLGTPVGIIWSIWNLTSVSRYPCRYYMEFDISL